MNDEYEYYPDYPTRYNSHLKKILGKGYVKPKKESNGKNESG